MIVVMSQGASSDELENVKEHLSKRGLKVHMSEGIERTVVGVIGQIYPELQSELELMDGVGEVVRISKPYKLASKEFKSDDTVISIGEAGVKIGGGEFVVFGGPCAIESEEQVMETARAVKKSGATVLRGGAFKPRTSPYSFRGMAEDGLKLMDLARKETGLPLITEVMSERDVDLVAQYTDVLQVGARNMQNFALLDEVGRTTKPVMVKRGFSATYEDWLLAAEYVMAGGNKSVILCERGIRTFETFTRNTMDLNAIPVIKQLSHLPIVSDPSHGTGKWDYVTPLACASVAAGADGLIIEVHPRPETAWSDGAQSLTLENFDALMSKVRAIRSAMSDQP
ncbi:MAG: 3-deoxy-7-phosphoheptulonate synthase [Dehalococcoidia bacterium]|nr:3-deoxy-7-phosphoheptulonate synthase [Dehalococcoidia bacterium]MQG15548.1 3-deoxy-7-phosphoheptulonate synthase [SAR202 cluster bacterium]